MGYVLETYSSGNLFGKSLFENPCGDICHEKKYFQQSHEDIPPKGKNILGDIPQDTAFILKILCERYATKQSVKGNCLPNKLRMEISSKQIPKETSTKEYLEKHAYKKHLKRNLYEKKSEEKTLPKRMFKQFLNQKLSRLSCWPGWPSSW